MDPIRAVWVELRFGMDGYCISRAFAITSAAITIPILAPIIAPSIQLRGGIGINQRDDGEPLFKRLTAIDLTFGDTELHISAVRRNDCGVLCARQRRDLLDCERHLLALAALGAHCQQVVKRRLQLPELPS